MLNKLWWSTRAKHSPVASPRQKDLMLLLISHQNTHNKTIFHLIICFQSRKAELERRSKRANSWQIAWKLQLLTGSPGKPGGPWKQTHVHWLSASSCMSSKCICNMLLKTVGIVSILHLILLYMTWLDHSRTIKLLIRSGIRNWLWLVIETKNSN